MESMQELMKKKQDLKRSRDLLRENSTKKIDLSLNEIEGKINDHKVKEAEKNKKEWDEMALMIGEMFQMAFKLYVFKGIDIGLQLVNHVQWIEIKSLSYKYDDSIDWFFKFAKEDEFGSISPTKEIFIDAYNKVKSIYKDNFGENHEM